MYYLYKLMPRSSTIDVEIVLSEKCDAEGYTMQLDNKSKGRLFEVEIKAGTDVLLVLAHEMIHVMQLARGFTVCEDYAYDNEEALKLSYLKHKDNNEIH